MKCHYGWTRSVVYGVVLLIVAPALSAQQSNIALTIVPASPANFEQVVLRITTNVTCVVDPQLLRLSVANNTIRVDMQPRRGTCVPVGATESYDVVLGRFAAGSFQVAGFYGDAATAFETVPFVVTDTYGSKTGPFPLVDFTDHWWNPGESGWGMSIMQHPNDRLFAVWFVYGQNNQPTWYTLQPGSWTSPTTYTGPIYKTAGPYFGGAFDPTQVSIILVGSGTFTFSDYANGVFSYSIDGILGTKSITRFSF
jgi:hypothetical protein